MRLNRAASVYMKRADVEVVAMKIGHLGTENLYTPHCVDLSLNSLPLFFFTFLDSEDQRRHEGANY